MTSPLGSEQACVRHFERKEQSVTAVAWKGAARGRGYF